MNNLNDKAVTIKNLTWDSNASKQNVEKAAQKITSAIEKSTGKITAAVKDGTKTISEATRKIANASGNQTAPIVSAVSAGLTSIAESTAQTADYLRSHPTELKRTAETMEGIGRQFTDLTACASQAAENGECLWGLFGETKKMAEYLGNNFSGGGGSAFPLAIVHSGG